MSKDGDWIVREDQASLDHVLGVLEDHRAEYRFGAPLDLRWLRGGWSSHFEFRRRSLRVRTDFVTRPPRLEPDDLARLWAEVQGMDVPVLDPRRLAEIKKTDREKDYPVIAELARRVEDPREQMLLSRSARDLIALAAHNPELVGALQSRRPVLALIASGRKELERALDEERRQLMRLRASSSLGGTSGSESLKRRTTPTLAPTLMACSPSCWSPSRKRRSSTRRRRSQAASNNKTIPA